MKSYIEERFPHLLPGLYASWGDRDAFDEIMRELMFDRRGGRIGFPLEAWEELRFLQKLHQILMRIKHGDINEPLPDELKWV